MRAVDLKRAMPGLSAGRAKQLVGPCNKAMIKGQITNKRRAAAFLAQIGHESVSLRYKAEIGGPSTRYAPYYGRTFIQITWAYNYRAFGRWLGVGDRFVNHPALLEQDRYAFLGAVWYWTTHGLNAYADRGEFDKITRIINGGWNGHADRRNRWAICKRLGSAILPSRPDPLRGTSRPERDRSNKLLWHRRKYRALAKAGKRNSEAFRANKRWASHHRAWIENRIRAHNSDLKRTGDRNGRRRRIKVLKRVVAATDGRL